MNEVVAALPETTTAVPMFPAGEVANNADQFTWLADEHAVWYAVFVKDASGNGVINLSVSPEQANCSGGEIHCSVSAEFSSIQSGGDWWVRVWYPDDNVLWSQGVSFSLVDPEPQPELPVADDDAPMIAANCENGAARWSDPESWGGSMPGEGESAVIPSGSHIGLDIDSPALAGVTVHGRLSFCRADLALTADWMMIHGTLQIGSEETPFEEQATITLTGLDESTGPMETTRTLMIMGGTVSLYGTPPAVPWTRVNNDVQAGDLELTLVEAVNWAPGDTLVLAPTDFYGVNPTEILTMQATTGNQITLTEPASYFHWGRLQYLTDSGLSLNPLDEIAPHFADSPTRLDERAEIGNLSRNIVIQSIDDDAWRTEGYGAHIMIMSLSSRVETGWG